LPTQEEINLAFQHPESKQRLFQQIEAQFTPKPASRNTTPKNGKWFGNGDHIPDMEDMRDPSKLAEILKEADSLFGKR